MNANLLTGLRNLHRDSFRSSFWRCSCSRLPGRQRGRLLCPARSRSEHRQGWRQLLRPFDQSRHRHSPIARHGELEVCRPRVRCHSRLGKTGNTGRRDIGTRRFPIQRRIPSLLCRIDVREQAFGHRPATNKTLDPKSPDYHWKDCGKVIQTGDREDWNAIDPSIFLDGDPPGSALDRFGAESNWFG